MIECYYRWCEFHSKNAPLCNRAKCEMTEEKLIEFKQLRKEELKEHDKS